MEVNSGYAQHMSERLAQGPAVVDKRLTAEQQATAAAERALRAKKWSVVFGQMINDMDSRIGSRRPTSAPEWVTLEVLNGGFASGEFLAAIKPSEVPNSEFLTPAGLEKLWEMLDSGKYAVEYPEHAALMVVAWLSRQQQGGAQEGTIAKLLGELQPWMTKLRFYPLPAENPIEVSPRVCLRTVEQVRDNLRAVVSMTEVPRMKLLALQRKVITTVLPFKWDLIRLFSETVFCSHIPHFKTAVFETVATTATSSTTTTTSQQDSKKKVKVVMREVNNHSLPVFWEPQCDMERGAEDSCCGWPCQRFPEGWMDRAKALHATFQSLASPAQNLSTGMKTLTRCLDICVKRGAASLTPQDVCRLRNVLAGFNTKTKGTMPGSVEFEATYKPRVMACAGVGSVECAKQVMQRLEKCDGHTGLQDPSLFLTPINVNGTTLKSLPRSLCAKVNRARLGTINELLDAGIIPSAEVLATLIPALTANAISVGVADESLRRLHFALQVSFSRRRSLLLLNLEKQVRIHELPWSQAITPFVNPTSSTNHQSGVARETLSLVAGSALRKFPQTILPNKLLQSLSSLNETAHAGVPILEELASDIFMGAFAPKFLKAALIAANVMPGTTYSKYYDLDSVFSQLREDPQFRLAAAVDKKKADNKKQTEAFYQLCYRLSGLQKKDQESGQPNKQWHSPGENGTVIESAMLLTTHNLATLVSCLGLKLPWGNMVVDVWKWMLTALKTVKEGKAHWKSRLQLSKDVAYAWRQALFFFSQLDPQVKLQVHSQMQQLLMQPKNHPKFEQLSVLLSSLPSGERGAQPALFAWVSGRPWILGPAPLEPKEKESDAKMEEGYEEEEQGSEDGYEEEKGEMNDS